LPAATRLTHAALPAGAPSDGVSTEIQRGFNAAFTPPSPESDQQPIFRPGRAAVLITQFPGRLMMRIRFLQLLGLLACLFVLPSAFAMEPGEAMPGLELPGAGQTVKLGKQPGKVIYLDFWASWCSPCRQSFPWMNALQEKYKAQDLEVIAVNLDAQAGDAEKFLAKVPARFTIAYDPKGTSAKAYGVKGMPTSLLIGRDGKVIYQHMGFNEEGRDKLEKMIQAAVEAKK
jgi:cytochrome c biogenesis protein CcmG, thiol:disulfide interchange protein DsbE